MEPQQQQCACLPWWLRANAVCQVIVSAAPLTTLVLLVLTGYFPDNTWKHDIWASFFWWYLVFLPYVFVPTLIVPFAMATSFYSSMSMSTASTLETWKSFFATAMYITWFVAGPGVWYPQWIPFTVLGAVLLLVLFYPALVYTWKVWHDNTREEIKQRHLQYEEEMNRRRAAQRRAGANVNHATETSPLLRQN